MQTLDRLFGLLGASAPPLPVTGLTTDSRKAGPGQIFIALRGRHTDGHSFIAEAAERGVAGIIGELEWGEVAEIGRGDDGRIRRGVPYLRVPNARIALSHLAAALHDYPARELYLVGVTGTKGKTTTSLMTHHLLESAGLESGLICTIGLWNGHEPVHPPGHVTTPEAPALQAALASWRDHGLRHGVIETSSHALALHRVDDVAYDLAIWSTLHPEHLDFHGDLESYFQAKASLIERAEFAILNADCPYAMRLRHRPHLTYGIGQGDLYAEDVIEGPYSVSFTLHSPGEAGREVLVPGIGSFNVYNALAALAAAREIGIPLEDALRDLTSFRGVPGRMQIVRNHPVRIVVDFAHTPESLALAIAALRPGTRGRLLLLTGAGGGRDPRKRLPIGQLAIENADLTVFSEEDYGEEPLSTILATLERGARSAGGRLGQEYFIIRNRSAAIRFLISNARPGDTVLLAGKGHERYLEREMGEVEWDEVEEARRWI